MHRTAGRRGFTPLAPIATIALVRAKASQSALLCLLVLSAPGCGDNSTPTPLTPTPLPSPSETVTLEGRVLDELDKPVEGARIRMLSNSGGSVPSTTADDAGSFTLNVDWPANWPSIALRIDREGYESADARVQRAEATRAVLINMYRFPTIRPGESIQLTLSFPWGDCGPEPLCRRAMVDAPSGTLVDLEAMPAEGQEYVGLAPRDQLFWGASFPSRVTVPGGVEVWIFVRQPGQVTLRAAGR